MAKYKYRLQSSKETKDIKFTVSKEILPYLNEEYRRKKVGDETLDEFAYRIVKQTIGHTYKARKAEEDKQLRESQFKDDQEAAAIELNGVFD